jgi:hypothetical protein
VCHNFSVWIDVLVVFCVLVWLCCPFWLHKLTQAAEDRLVVFCFFSVCRRAKPYVDDINLETVESAVFCCQAVSRVERWL